ncbi:MAG: hypothetical protein ACHQFW_10185 [Chitinophagales bacterium]
MKIITNSLMAPTKTWIQSTLTEIALLGEIELSDPAPVVVSQDDLKIKLTEMIAYLMDHNFEKLLWILYRIDVDEEKAKSLLAKHLPEEAPAILAELIILRQLKKDEIKKEFNHNPTSLTEEDEALRL